GLKALNRRVVQSRANLGDVDAQDLLLMLNEYAMEYAKLSVGTAQGDENTRREARDKLEAGLTLNQLKSNVATLERAGNNRKASWEKARDTALSRIGTLGGRLKTPVAPPIGLGGGPSGPDDTEVEREWTDPQGRTWIQGSDGSWRQ